MATNVSWLVVNVVNQTKLVTEMLIFNMTGDLFVNSSVDLCFEIASFVNYNNNNKTF